MRFRRSITMMFAVLPVVAVACSGDGSDTPAGPPAEDVNENEIDADDGNGALDGDGDDGNGALDGDGDDGNGALDGAND